MTREKVSVRDRRIEEKTDKGKERKLRDIGRQTDTHREKRETETPNGRKVVKSGCHFSCSY